MSQIDKSNLADEYLEQAIECFLDSHRYASALHLAGAAQEIYGSLIKSDRSQNFLTVFMDVVEREFKKQGREFDRSQFLSSNRTSKNSVKHMDDKKNRYISINLEKAALTMLLEALADALLLQKAETANIKRFKEYFIANAINFM